MDYTFDRRIELEGEDAWEEERANTERERQLAKEERQLAKEERQLAKEERQRAELAEKEVQKLRAELEQYKRQFSKADNQDMEVVSVESHYQERNTCRLPHCGGTDAGGFLGKHGSSHLRRRASAGT